MSIVGVVFNFVFFGIPKFILTFGGIGFIGWGLLTGPRWALIGLGVAAILAGRILHAIDGALLDRKLIVWAEHAASGIGPVPPGEVRKELARQAAGLRGNFEHDFMMLCARWSAIASQRPRVLGGNFDEK